MILVALAVLAAGALDAALPVPAPWNGDGHRIVCQIAWERLGPAAKAEVSRLIELDSEYDSFAMACVWADAVRSQIREGRADVQRFEPYTPSHYMNTPAGSAGVAAAHCTPDTPGGTRSPCVLDAIAEFADSLVHSTDDRRRLEALKFIGHFVGDVHQPLHAGYGEDRGGNDVEVSVMGQPRQNLHAIWDGFFIEHQDREWEEYAQELGSRIRPVDERLWRSLEPREWADESYQIVEDGLYRDVRESGGYVGQLYFDRHIGTVERQLRKAGVRLARLLESLLVSEHGS